MSQSGSQLGNGTLRILAKPFIGHFNQVMHGPSRHIVRSCPGPVTEVSDGGYYASLHKVTLSVLLVQQRHDIIGIHHL